MYARVATFEGDPARIDDGIRDVRAGFAGDVPEALRDVRLLMLVNRTTGKGFGVTLWDSEEEMRRGDEALEALPGPHDHGRRIAVDFYEVPVNTLDGVGR